MFTGLVEGIGKIKDIIISGGDMRLAIMPLFAMDDCSIGDSVAVNGTCLTVTGFSKGLISMDVSQETVSRSTIGNLGRGDEVNLERALRLSDRLGGHLVAGHVDGVGTVLKKDKVQRSIVIRIGINEVLARHIIEKGSIAVDGISLTINHCQEDFFEVNIIPETSRSTTILNKNTGDLVNIETDLIAKYIEKFIKTDDASAGDEASSSIDKEMLIKYGFGE